MAQLHFHHHTLITTFPITLFSMLTRNASTASSHSKTFPMTGCSLCSSKSFTCARLCSFLNANIPLTINYQHVLSNPSLVPQRGKDKDENEEQYGNNSQVFAPYKSGPTKSLFFPSAKKPTELTTPPRFVQATLCSMVPLPPTSTT
jgi:hypothetical protein